MLQIYVVMHDVFLLQFLADCTTYVTVELMVQVSSVICCSSVICYWLHWNCIRLFIQDEDHWP